MRTDVRQGMLRIVINGTQARQNWVLQGRLAGAMVEEVVSAWRNTRDERSGRVCIVDLVEVTFISESGEQVLAEMMGDGAEFVSRGVYTKDLLATIKKQLSRTKDEVI